MIEIATAFNTSGEPLLEFFQQPNVGYYIPLYQRDYSWDTGNIDQLTDDIFTGVDKIFEDDNDIHFMGTLILVTEKNPKANIEPIDHRALPKTIQNVIDGQQRISTVCLLACLLYRRICLQLAKVPKKHTAFDELNEEVEAKLNSLYEIISVDLMRGTPRRKPKIIRGQDDQWTFDGQPCDNYHSAVSSYLAKVIDHIENGSQYPSLPPQSMTIGKNLRAMKSCLDSVEEAFKDSEDRFPGAFEIVTNIKDEKYIWSYERPALKALILDIQSPGDKVEEAIFVLIQMFTFCHYLFERCCFTIIEPINDDWAFDMFQSLNATGTPLTAYETFKPLVVNVCNTEDKYKNSETESDLNTVDEVFKTATNAAQKTRITNDFLTTFALIDDGTKLANQFSVQRKHLIKRFNAQDCFDAKKEYIRSLKHLALYWSEVLAYSPDERPYLPRIKDVDKEDQELASLCILYNKDAGHKMANTILSRFYTDVILEKDDSQSVFVDAVKAVTAFYTFWRSSSSNKGLDDAYRKMMREDKDGIIPCFSLSKGMENLSVSKLKKALQRFLIEKGIVDKKSWTELCLANLKYNQAKYICKFLLFLSSHDTITDVDSPGLMKPGRKGAYPYLTPGAWFSKHLKTIEHIAPQKAIESSSWDGGIYVNDDVNLIGNLTLLPSNVNSSLGNAEWGTKVFYYKHLSQVDEDKLSRLNANAKAKGVTLDQDTLDLLQNSEYAHHVSSIISVDGVAEWDNDMIRNRTKRICSIAWDRISGWVFD